MQEVFKDIKGYEGFYQISNLGRVKRLKRMVNVNIKNVNLRTCAERILKAVKKRDGYYQYHLCKKGVSKVKMSHQLVWDAFGTAKRNGRKLQVDHIDNNKQNNRINNLQLLTPRQNITKYHQQRKTSSKYTGVYWDKKSNKWRAYITHKKKRTYLGYFTDEYEAHLAYQKALENSGKYTEYTK